MSHTVSGKLFKAPFVKQLQDSTMYGIKLSEMTKDKNGEKSYVNYDVVLFAKSQGQIDFYNQATAEGSFVVVSCEKLKLKVSQCGQYTSLSMENARLENASYGTGGQPAPQAQSYGQKAPQQPAPQMAPAYQPAPQQQAPAPQQQQLAPKAPAQYNEPSMDFDDEIPF